MTRRFLRHNIVGNEVGRPRPPAYMRRGRTRRSRSRKTRRTPLIVFALFLMAVLMLGLVATSRFAG